MGDLNNAGGHDVWAKLVSFGKNIWLTELDRRGGSSAHAPGGPCSAMDQPTYLAHEISLLANLSAASGGQLKAILIYELYDEPQQGNGYPRTCSTGNTSVNGESCYGLVRTNWHAGPGCDQYASCNFTAAPRKPAWKVVREWAKQLSW